MRSKHILCIIFTGLLFCTLRMIQLSRLRDTFSLQDPVSQFVPDTIIKESPSLSCHNILERNIHFADRSLWQSLTKEEKGKRTDAWKNFRHQVIPTLKYEKFGYEGRGIVYTANNLSLKRCLVSVKMLREHGCNLPVQVWYMGDELSGMEKEVEELASFHAVTKDLLEEQEKQADKLVKEIMLEKAWFYGHTRNYHMKSLVLLLCPFEEVLYLDSDNIPLHNPEYLFESAEFREKGAIFWHDFWKFPNDNPMWEILELECEDEWEQESGQLLLNKRQVFESLLMSIHFQQQHEFFFRIILGDKDTFRLSFKIMSQPYHSIYPVALAGRMYDGRFCGHTMMQRGLRGEYLFAHTTVMKGTNNLKEGETWNSIQYFEEQPKVQESGLLYRGYPVVVEYGGVEYLPGGFAGRVPCIDFHIDQLRLENSEQWPHTSYRLVQEPFSIVANGQLADFEDKYYQLSLES